MSRHDACGALRDMLDHAREALELVEGKQRADLEQNRLLQLGLVRLLEITGEAASRVPDEVRSQCPQIPWSQVVGVRNRLIHAYDAVDYDVVWEIAVSDLPELVAKLETFLSSYENE